MLAVTGGLRPFEGEVWVQGKEIREYKRADLARAIALLPQKTPVTFPYSAMEVVLMGRHPYTAWNILEGKDDIAAAQEAMERLEISELANRNFMELSGGEQQTVLLARAFTQQTPVMVLDEPTSALDLKRQAVLMRELRKFCQQGGAVLASFHDLNLAAQACDELLLLADGKVIATGSPDKVLDDTLLAKVYGVEVRKSSDSLGRTWVGL